MRILIDVGNSASGGSLRYLKGLLSSKKTPQSIQFFVLCSFEIKKKLDVYEPNIRYIEDPKMSSPSFIHRLSWWRNDFKKLTERIKPDIIFHRSGLLRGRSERSIPRIIFFGNILPFNKDGLLKCYSSKLFFFRMVYFRFLYTRSYRRADGVIFPSYSSASSVLKKVKHISNHKVIYHGLEESFKKQKVNKQNLNEPINILYVSPIDLYKNQWNVVEAISNLRTKLAMKINLTLIGNKGNQLASKMLNEAILNNRACSFVKWIDFLPTGDLMMNYQNTDIFVFASSCENSPFILREAMGWGLPIASSKTTSMPEFLKDAGVYFDPDEPESISNAVELLIKDSTIRFQSKVKASNIASTFNWDRCTESTIHFFNEIITKKLKSKDIKNVK